MKASDLVKSESATKGEHVDHPLTPTFQKWLRGKEPTKNKARQFLAAFPHYHAGK